MTVSPLSNPGGRLTRLEAERRARGLTQAQLALLVGCAPKTIGGIERGRLAPSSILLRGFAMALGFQDDAETLLADALAPATAGPGRQGQSSE